MANITCLHSSVKQVLRAEAGHVTNPADQAELEEMLRQIPDCPAGTLMGVGAGKKRATSAYNVFVRECLKEEGNNLKGCAIRWRAMPPQEKERYKP